jgi:hypothetical protein
VSRVRRDCCRLGRCVCAFFVTLACVVTLLAVAHEPPAGCEPLVASCDWAGEDRLLTTIRRAGPEAKRGAQTAIAAYWRLVGLTSTSVAWRMGLGCGAAFCLAAMVVGCCVARRRAALRAR